MTQEKLGLEVWRAGEEGDEAFVAELHRLLQVGEMDMTLFYRRLGGLDLSSTQALCAQFDHVFYDAARRADVELAFEAWLQTYATRVRQQDLTPAQRQQGMDAVNPLYVPRNYLAQQAIDQAEQGDPEGVMELLDVLRRPYVEQAGREAFAARRPEWARHKAGCSMLSCSS